jgi:hypothetical protein
MRNLLTIVAALAVAIPLLAPRAEAQTSFLTYLGYDLEFEELLLGVGAEFGLPVGLPVALSIRPTVEYFFISGDATLLQFNGDVSAALMPAAPIGVFAGAGVGVQTVSFAGASATEVGLNLFGGAEFGSGFAVPFAQLRVSFFDHTALALMGGVKLRL